MFIICVGCHGVAGGGCQAQYAIYKTMHSRGTHRLHIALVEKDSFIGQTVNGWRNRQRIGDPSVIVP